MGKPALPAKSCGEEFSDCFLGETKIREAFAIRFADKMICALHRALAFFEPFYLINQLFHGVRVVVKDGPVGFHGRSTSAKIFCCIVVLLCLGKVLIDALEVFAVPFFGMVPNQNWLTRRDHFKSLPGGKVPPGGNVFVLFSELPKASRFLFAFGLKIVHGLEKVRLELESVRLDPVISERRDQLIEEVPKRLLVRQLGKLFELYALCISESFRLVDKIEVCVAFERKNVCLNAVRQVAGDREESDSAFMCCCRRGSTYDRI